MKDKKILFGIIITFLFLFSAGFTYAYFSTTTNVVGERKDIKASVGTLSVLYTDGPEIVAENIQPGWTTTKTVKVTNTGTLKAYYSLVWASLTNVIENDELIFSATCTSNIGSCDNLSSQVVNINEAVAYGKPLLQNEEHTYVITFMFKETGSAQNYNQDKAFNGVLNVIDAIESNTVVGTLLDSNGDPINGATVEMHSDVKTGITDTKGYFEIRGVEVGTHELIVKDSTNTEILSDSLTITSGAALGVTNNNITNITDKGVLNISVKLSSAPDTIEEINVYPSLKDKILSDNTVYADSVSSPYVSSASGIDFTAKATHTNGQGLYTNNKLEDGKNTYFRGGSYCAYTNYIIEDLTGTYCTAAGGTWNTSNYKCNLDLNRATCTTQGFTYYDLKNNVLFAGKKWRIIRIDENNNIRMLLAEDNVTNSAFNSSYNNNAYVGYMYGGAALSYEETHANTTNSTIKTAVDTWYNTNLANYRNYLADAGYCNDRSVTSGLGYGISNTNYKPYTRNGSDSTASPRISISEGCSNALRDLFTTKNSTIGNKALTNPIALITVDEARYAGMVSYGETAAQHNFINYLRFNYWYWTMSPMSYGSSASNVYGVHPYGPFKSGFVHAASAFRPSVSLKYSTSVTSGSGTYDDPYIIQ